MHLTASLSPVFFDLAVGNTAGFSADPVGHIISILLNNNDGSGTFTALATANSPATNGFVSRLVAADLNEDGNLDLLAVDNNTSPNGVRLYLGDGTGHFAAASVISTTRIRRSRSWRPI
jgi:hypothetical protein